MICALQIIAAFGIVAGAGFCLLASVGLVRFPDLYTRIHAASKAGVVGAGLILLALAVVSLDVSIVLRSIVAILFLLITTPISAHLLSRSAYLTGLRPDDITKTDELAD
jgi:multicomponent Na+:H+ antiporter subunit G